MGRLDDIIERNKRALRAEAGVLSSVWKPRARSGPGEPPPAADQPVQPRRMFEDVVAPRKRTTPAWKVIPFMLVILFVIGWQACEGTKADERDRERREQHWRQEHWRQEHGQR